MQAYKSSTLERIHSRCHIDHLKGCLVWGGTSGGVRGGNYAKIKAKCPPDDHSKTHYVHRVVYQFHFDVILDNNQKISHLCHNCLCCNPHHLVLEPFVVNNSCKLCASSGQ